MLSFRTLEVYIRIFIYKYSIHTLINIILKIIMNSLLNTLSLAGLTIIEEYMTKKKQL
jgi:hypothetical protein